MQVTRTSVPAAKLQTPGQRDLVHRERGPAQEDSPAGEHVPGEDAPENPDYNGDGEISEAEAQVYRENIRAQRDADRHELEMEKLRSKERVEMFRTQSENYRAEMQAEAAKVQQIASGGKNGKGASGAAIDAIQSRSSTSSPNSMVVSPLIQPPLVAEESANGD